MLYYCLVEHPTSSGSKPKDLDSRQLSDDKSFNHSGERPLLQKEGSFVLQKEDSFIRTGSGRKLPKIPQRSLSANSGNN